MYGTEEDCQEDTPSIKRTLLPNKMDSQIQMYRREKYQQKKNNTDFY